MPRSLTIARLSAFCLMAFIAAGPVFAAQKQPATPQMPAAEKSSQSGAYLAGRYAQSLEDWAAASRFLNNALATDPDDTSLLNHAIALLVNQGHIAEAMPLARHLEKLGKATHLSGTLLGIDALINNNPEAAVVEFRKLPTEGLTKFVTPLLIAWGEAAAGHQAAAIDALKDKVDQPGFTSLNSLQAGLIAALAGNDAVAGARLSESVAANPSLRAIQLVGIYDERHGKPDAARALYEDFIKVNPDTTLMETPLARLNTKPIIVPAAAVANPREGLAEALFGIGSALHSQGADELGLIYGRLALFLRPELPLAQIMVADILTMHDHGEDALAIYRALSVQVAKSDPGLDWLIRLRMADILDSMGKSDEAIALLNGMVKERPGRTDAILMQAELLRQSNHMDAAVVAYTTAIGRVHTIEARHWTLFYGRALAYGDKHWDQAEPDLQRALALNPDEPYVLNYLGYSWVDRGEKLEEAKKLIEHAMTLKPDESHIVDSMGWALFRLGDINGAIAQLEHALELTPQDPDVNDHLGDVYWAANRHLEAHFQWQRALANAGKDTTLAASVKAKLASHPERAQTADSEHAPSDAAP